MSKKIIAFLAAITLLAFSGCGKTTNADAVLQDGYYTAEMSEFSHGWKEFVTINVRDGQLVTAEYNARNSSGFIKSWDMEYMRTMNMYAGNYPNRYTRDYAAKFLNSQSPDSIDALAGATNSNATFKLLAAATIEHAQNGDETVALVSET